MTQCGRRHEGVKVADISVGLLALLKEPNLRPLIGSGWDRKEMAQDAQHRRNLLLRKQLKILTWGSKMP
ncbi:hypothetical protein B5M09_010404 [Aphanomyces astaci]|uniref:Uncharacterized protein n=1 Tax=Aphanomyces astaci TaxID=112090 RepID=A0A425CU64_APHAT|nr:hypothetical protein B5M09_010404 [Aphanomyces astaci]